MAFGFDQRLYVLHLHTPVVNFEFVSCFLVGPPACSGNSSPINSHYTEQLDRLRILKAADDFMGLSAGDFLPATTTLWALRKVRSNEVGNICASCQVIFTYISQHFFRGFKTKFTSE